MIEVAIKQLNKQNRWEAVPLEAMLHNSIIDYMEQSQTPVIACMTVDPDHKLFVSNDPGCVERYKDKGISIHSSTMKELFDSKFDHQMITNIVEVFPDARLKIRRPYNSQQEESKNGNFGATA